MITNFGKFCRKLRIDNGELLKDMASKLDVTASYLSAVENGKRGIPTSWKNIIIEKYQLAQNEIKILKESILNSQKEVRFDLKELTDIDKDLVLAFARKLEELDDIDKDKIKKILR